MAKKIGGFKPIQSNEWASIVVTSEGSLAVLYKGKIHNVIKFVNIDGLWYTLRLNRRSSSDKNMYTAKLCKVFVVNRSLLKRSNFGFRLRKRYRNL